MPLRLPPIGLPVPADWWEDSQSAWATLNRSAQRLHADPAIRQTQRLAELLRDPLLRDDHAAVIALLEDPKMAGALAYLWSEPDGDCADTVTPDLLHALGAVYEVPATLTTHYLLSVYLTRYDELDRSFESPAGERPLDTLCELLRPHLVHEAGAPGTSLPPQEVLGRDAPQAIASRIRRRGLDAEQELKRIGLLAHDGGRFMQLVRNYLYLEELTTVSVGSDCSSLAAVQNPDVATRPHVEGRMLGHAAAEILLDRSGATYPGEVWRDAVISIAGDPRLTYLDSHTTWWRVLGAEREQKALSWLARADLQLFLDAFKDFADQSGQAAMRRMYAPRKRMLEGLVEAGIVRRSRLFLGQDVRRHMLRSIDGDKLSASAFLEGRAYAERALIYLDCGDFHIVEGSHNTQLWIYLSRPGLAIVDPRQRRFHYEELTSELASRFQTRWHSEMGDSQGVGHAAVPHRGHLWQAKFLQFLAGYGIRVDPESVLSRENYQELRRRGEIPWINPDGRPQPLNRGTNHEPA